MKTLGLEELWSCIDHYAKFRDTEFSRKFLNTWPEPDLKSTASHQLKKALLRMYGQKCDQAAKKLQLCYHYTLGKIIKRIRPGDIVISLNYDSLIERLITKRTDVKLIHCNGNNARAAVRFAKPHGSASWKLGDSRWSLHQPKMKFLSPEDVLNISSEPLLLGAVPIKSELLREVQRCSGCSWIFDIVLSQWHVVAEAVRDSDLLVILGYSFPKQDEYARFFFLEGMIERAKLNRKRLKIQYYLPHDHTKDILDFFDHLIHQCDIEYMREVSPAPLSCFKSDLLGGPKWTSFELSVGRATSSRSFKNTWD